MANELQEALDAELEDGYLRDDDSICLYPGQVKALKAALAAAEQELRISRAVLKDVFCVVDKDNKATFFVPAEPGYDRRRYLIANALGSIRAEVEGKAAPVPSAEWHMAGCAPQSLILLGEIQAVLADDEASTDAIADACTRAYQAGATLAAIAYCALVDEVTVLEWVGAAYDEMPDRVVTDKPGVAKTMQAVREEQQAQS